MAKEPFQIGDPVILTTAGSVPACPKWVVVGSYPNLTYNVQCATDETLVQQAAGTSLHTADSFGYNCGDPSPFGVCGLVQLCPSSDDSIDGTCPGPAQNKSEVCLDLNPIFCKTVRKYPRMCSQPYHGPNVSVTCCDACKGYHAPSPRPPPQSERGRTRNKRFATHAALVLCSLATAVVGCIVVLARRRKQRELRAAAFEESFAAVEATANGEAEAEYLEMATPRGTADR
ncbi:unnamed protein product [Symbiodinium sp. KB8]|nr:unnamed protein product [Symbiodinium sp. KB8]